MISHEYHLIQTNRLMHKLAAGCGKKTLKINYPYLQLIVFEKPDYKSFTKSCSILRFYFLKK